MRYVAFIHSDTDPGFGVSFPDFPGCVSVGDSIDEAIHRGTEALAFHVEGMIQDGEQIPEPRPVQDIEADPDLAEWQDGAVICLVPLIFRQRIPPARQHFPGLRSSARYRSRGKAAWHDPLGFSVQRGAERNRKAIAATRCPRYAHHCDLRASLRARDVIGRMTRREVGRINARNQSARYNRSSYRAPARG